jgi:hypothetical protein
MEGQGCSWFLGRMLGALAALFLYVVAPLIIVLILVLIFILLR